MKVGKKVLYRDVQTELYQSPKWKIEIGLNKPIILCLQCQVNSAIFCEEKEFQFIFQSFLRTEIFFWTLIFSLLDKGFSILAWFNNTFLSENAL